MLQLFVISLHSCDNPCKSLTRMKWILHWHFLSFPLELHQMRDYFELATLSKENVSLFETGNENDASDFTDLPEKNGHKILASSESGICSCGAEWDKRSIQDESLYVDLCSVAYFCSIHDVKVYCRPCSSCATKKHYDGI
ncbi:uncharacterized protein LOC124447131 [Xenia sp. Carnegie-2017]|uniref:uncharacterized protein LOC124447131 n=1 Tax=Xenia sp. Carnegie-2017 TaxID=2897299 RepID=UPI001F03D04C|nr:uncharacterized protein LOC124447131 [Xenia sp. Carnegie-2017]